MAFLLHDLEQVAERRRLGRLRMHEENGRASRALPRRGVDQFEALLLHVVVRLADIGHAQRHVGETATSAVLFDLLRHRRFVVERLEQLHQVRAAAHLEQDLADLVASQHVLAMHFQKAQRAVRRHLGFEFTGPYRNGHVIEELKSGDLIQFGIHYSNSTTTCPFCTLSPGPTLMALIFPATGEVTLVSIFMASRISNTSPTCRVWPGCAVARTTMPETGLRATLSSFT